MELAGARGWVRAWWPALLWAGFIFTMSTDTFSAEHTASIIKPALLWIMPSMSDELFKTIHHFIRKGAHFTEYFVFCLLLYRSVRGGHKGWRWKWGAVALFCAAGYSVLDEIHQVFVASRGPSAYDSLLDSVGAFAAFIAVWLWFRWRRSARETQVAVSKAPSA
jgi:VanZ family protein